MRRWKLILLVPLMFLPGPAQRPVHSQDPVSELRKLSEAINEAKTRARFEAELTSYAFSEEDTTVARVRFRYAYPYKRRESIEGSGTPRFVVLEDGTHQWSYFPARNMVVKEPLRKEDSPFPLSPTDDLNLLAENYELVISGPVPAGAGMPGMQCRIVEFIPRSGDRPRREFWLEERWSLPIRVRITSPDGRPAYVAELSKILWDPGLDEDDLGLKVPRDTKVYEIQEKDNLTREEAERLLKRRLVLPTAIPEGYRPQNIVVRVEGPKQCLQVIYTDGLSSFSYFQEWPCPKKAKSQTGPQTAVERADSVLSARRYGLMNLVTLPGTNLRTVIVGDIHKDRLVEMAESLRGSLRQSLSESLGESFHQEVPPP
jgi:outer membrane lipoprotein-sorting protein